MASEHLASVVLCWHMHQPVYQDLGSGDFLFPWVYLHAIKDYSDMAAHLEAHPGARAVVNFAPVLLEQIEEYLSQIERWQHGSGALGDPLLAALVSEDLPAAGTPAFLKLVGMCLRANRERIIQRFPHYANLARLAEHYRDKPEVQMYLDKQFLVDLVVWYHLGWMGEAVRRSHPVVRGLLEKARGFSRDDRFALMEVINEILANIGPRYRRLAEKHQLELSVSPYSHPMLPLLLDLGSAREAMPDVALPHSPGYPGGHARAEWQLRKARAVFKRFFDIEPAGCWSSEGGLSQPVLALLSEQGFRWTASGDSVLYHSLEHSDSQGHLQAPHGVKGEARPHTAFRFGTAGVEVFFRDDGLSDLIGFTYADWHAEDAVGDLVHHLETIAKSASRDRPCVISIIMDGENAWEYYPENGFYFLDELYRRLESHRYLNLSTFSDVLDTHPGQALELPGIVAGSWIYGTFSTWIGDQDKNRAWDLLCEAKQHFDAVLDAGTLSAEDIEKATLQLAICEGSDWFWWFGDYNPPETVSDFEHLFRRHLINLYDLIRYPAPARVFQRISQGGGTPERGGAMRHGHTEQGTR